MKKLLFLLPFLVLSHSLSSFADGGGMVGGHGGDPDEMRFSAIGEFVSYTLSSQKDLKKLFPMVDPKKFEETVEDATIRMLDVPCLMLGDQSVAAINYPAAQHIDVSRVEWNSVALDKYERMAIVMHEYLGLMAVEQDRYGISSKLYFYFIRHPSVEASYDRFFW